jgi:lysozyme
MKEALDIAKTIAKPFEGFRSRPYLCPAGVATIGYGSTMYPDGHKVTLSDPPVTEQEAEALLDWEMAKCVAGAMRYCPGLGVDSGKLGAIADFCFNLGIGRLQTSTLRRRINQQDWPAAASELQRWVYAGGRKLRGLVLRREAEAAYFRGGMG